MKLPKISRIVIENFSLYKLQRKIEIDVNEGVMCLAGANGLGKNYLKWIFALICAVVVLIIVVKVKIESSWML